jgi:hypothetical protein
MKDGGYTRIGLTSDVLSIASEDFIDIDTGGYGPNDIENLTKGNESCMAITNIYGPDDQDIYLMYGGGALSDSSIQYEQPNVNGWFYALGVLKTTWSNPFELTNLTQDLDEPTMHPTDTNKIDYGLFDKCMFADTMIRHDNEWYFYYGAGDMYVGLAQARADFSAGASSYTIEGTTLSASTLALNKSYEDAKGDRPIEYVMEVHTLDGTLLHQASSLYEVPHFTALSEGKYARGIDVEIALDLETILDLPQNYYVTTYITDAISDDVINNYSHYLVVTPTVTHTPR